MDQIHSYLRTSLAPVLVMLTFLLTVPTHMLVCLLQASWLDLHCLAELPVFAPIPITEFSKKEQSP